MNKFAVSAVPLILAACTPTVQQSPAYTDQRSYTTTCAAALDEVRRVGPTLRPASLGGLGGWPNYSIASNTTSVTLVSTDAGGGPTFSTSSVWACAEANGKATLTVTSTGQTATATAAVHKAFWDAIKLPQ